MWNAGLLRAESIQEAEMVLKADPGFGQARLLLGVSLAAEGRRDEAIQTLEDLLGGGRLPEYPGRHGAVLAGAGKRAGHRSGPPSCR